MRQCLLVLGLVACGMPADDGAGDAAPKAEEEEGFYDGVIPPDEEEDEGGSELPEVDPDGGPNEDEAEPTDTGILADEVGDDDPYSDDVEVDTAAPATAPDDADSSDGEDDAPDLDAGADAGDDAPGADDEDDTEEGTDDEADVEADEDGLPPLDGDADADADGLPPLDADADIDPGSADDGDPDTDAAVPDDADGSEETGDTPSVEIQKIYVEFGGAFRDGAPTMAKEATGEIVPAYIEIHLMDSQYFIDEDESFICRSRYNLTDTFVEMSAPAWSTGSDWPGFPGMAVEPDLSLIAPSYSTGCPAFEAFVVEEGLGTSLRLFLNSKQYGYGFGEMTDEEMDTMSRWHPDLSSVSSTLGLSYVKFINHDETTGEPYAVVLTAHWYQVQPFGSGVGSALLRSEEVVAATTSDGSPNDGYYRVGSLYGVDHGMGYLLSLTAWDVDIAGGACGFAGMGRLDCDLEICWIDGSLALGDGECDDGAASGTPDFSCPEADYDGGDCTAK